MPVRQKSLKPRVFFNASVVLAGLASPSGGSGKLLAHVKQKQITGVISEIILDEIFRHTKKLGLSKTTVERYLMTLFTPIISAPTLKSVHKYASIVIDQGDSHVLASSRKTHADFLVTLDKKHLLALQHKIKNIRIVSPKELLEWLAKK